MSGWAAEEVPKAFGAAGPPEILAGFTTTAIDSR